MNNSNTEEAFYLFLKDEQKGPFSADEMKSMLQTRQISRKTLYWQEGFDEWIPLEETADILYPPRVIPPPKKTMGSAQSTSVSLPTDRRILPAFLLCFLFGSFGIHRMYCGRAFTGLMLGAFTLAGIICLNNREEFVNMVGGFLLVIAAVWTLIDLITVIVGGMKDGQGRAIKRWT